MEFLYSMPDGDLTIYGEVSDYEYEKTYIATITGLVECPKQNFQEFKFKDKTIQLYNDYWQILQEQHVIRRESKYRNYCYAQNEGILYIFRGLECQFSYDIEYDRLFKGFVFKFDNNLYEGAGCIPNFPQKNRCLCYQDEFLYSFAPSRYENAPFYEGNFQIHRINSEGCELIHTEYLLDLGKLQLGSEGRTINTVDIYGVKIFANPIYNTLPPK